MILLPKSPFAKVIRGSSICHTSLRSFLVGTVLSDAPGSTIITELMAVTCSSPSLISWEWQSASSYRSSSPTLELYALPQDATLARELLSLRLVTAQIAPRPQIGGLSHHFQLYRWLFYFHCFLSVVFLALCVLNILLNIALLTFSLSYTFSEHLFCI